MPRSVGLTVIYDTNAYMFCIFAFDSVLTHTLSSSPKISRRVLKHLEERFEIQRVEKRMSLRFEQENKLQSSVSMVTRKDLPNGTERGQECLTTAKLLLSCKRSRDLIDTLKF